MFSVSIQLFGIFQVFKFTDSGQRYMELEQRLVGSLLEFLPLVIAFAPLLLTLFVKTKIRYYYLIKFSEPFQKFNFDEDQWYGQL